ncbi:hypothetical protein AUEXF2481DRAFT_8232 [Aureobasidium subglaciale EXF-2481]|uniref:YTH domain-containing protein n=1 Tax=Aureobasidium subglaciale (strain EXF-2481) TaxID=1043005 RepID=A0A074YCA7_AURSE|nr:uncharacterized protein AUEXF2481DRAFT_8232 [Aureobasidium subglaciale EXF-2481]KAI5195505.1 hypothetical protein E4T38_09024 [Aureobasidium subglaciale]KAI5214491.1 hypothetical protein E4T40_08987 [Aureobasidium subglaciale]KAI5217211.1 hypothetical protein E4T41_08946 [Aureobasidium subglaciale]KAI5254960.1 hypothetical protein E4T46_08980 [Aureobasidium subglaciale]KEQ91772.1 hypothetical protein AUEXF2481DRAFT_8232 [Aureobasidium subglaciale EXF-2481]
MGEAPPAHDRHASGHLEHQQLTPVIGISQSPEESFTDSKAQAPFHSQFDMFPQVSQAIATQHGNYLSSYDHQHSVPRLDMKSLGHALPGSPTLSAPAQGFTQHPQSHIGRMPVQTLNMNSRTQFHQHGAQGPMAHGQAYLPSFAHDHYAPYAHTPSRMTLQAQGRPIFGHSMTAAMPYNSSGYTDQPHRFSTYLSHPRRDLVIEAATSFPRGPPRKPRQSGHALWVGNIPPGTTIGDLKDHFSHEATDDIESVFLISKSNCAFVNYRDEAACAAAMARFHESRFQGVRLVCRLRRGTPTSDDSTETPDTLTAGSDTKTDKSRPNVRRANSGPIIVDGSANHSREKEKPVGPSESSDIPNDTDEIQDGVTNPSRVPEKYFVVKSLTLADLEASVRNGVWATQSHNEVALNHAYDTADNVYLVFSANKSGEYFGYARMLSPIATNHNLASSAKLQPKPRDLDSGPKAIPTTATQWAPKGRIVDDSARGTIFWEADRSQGEDAVRIPQTQEEEASSRHQTQEWGKSFQIEWISTNRLPFYRTRGLRNPWNENREVKIARDGTEIEPGIGSRLVQMFHRPMQIPQGAVVMAPEKGPRCSV